MKKYTLLLSVVLFVIVLAVVFLTVKQQETLTPSIEATPPVIAATETQIETTTQSLTPSLSETLLNASGQSGIPTTYEQEVEKFIYSLAAHLGDFQLPDLGVTEQSMTEALNQSDVGIRINSLVNEVWTDWLNICKEKNLDIWTTEPNDYGLSPFRQLTVKLIQDRQGQLADSQQHALHNFFTRSEKQENWTGGIDGVIGAVNRESFRWP